MSNVLPIAVVLLPLVSAAVLASIPSWRVALWVNAGASTVLFVLTCGLPWQAPEVRVAVVHLALLTTFVAMLACWAGWRRVVLAVGHKRLRVYHAGFQLLVASILAALLTGRMALTWAALVVAVAASALVIGSARRLTASAAASRLVLSCGVGLMLALLGTLLLGSAPVFAGILLLLGYGALTGLPPWHAWLLDAAVAPAPGALIVSVLLANVPVLVLAELHIATWLLIAYGLAVLLSGAVVALIATEPRRRIAIAGAAQLGMVVFAIGIGGRAAIGGWLHLTLLALVRAAAWQTGAPDEPTRFAAVLALAMLPLYALFVLAQPMAAASFWLLFPLGAGALLICWAIIGTLPSQATGSFRFTSAPIWVQLAIAAVLALAMPAPVLGWFAAL